MNNSPDITVVGGTEANPIPTFGRTVGNVQKLAAADSSVAGLLGVLGKKMQAWDAPVSFLPLKGETPKEDIQKVINWITYSNDFVSLGEINEYIEHGLGDSVDKRAQPLTQEVYGSDIRSQQSIAWRKARDSLFQAIEPFMNQTKKDATLTEVNFWGSSPMPNGEFSLQNKEEMLATHTFQRIEQGNSVFYLPKGEGHNNLLDNLSKLFDEMEQIIGGQIPERKRMHILLVPGSKYCPRGGAADPRGRRMIVDISHPDRLRVAVHEFTHDYLAQAYGVSRNGAAKEGAAMFFSRQRFPLDPRNNYGAPGLWGFSDIIDLKAAGISVGLSPTQMLERRNKQLHPQEAYEYTYLFGGFLAEYLVTKHGKGKYLEFYQVGCKDNLYDSSTGKPLIQKGVVLVSQRELTKQSLKSVGLNPEEVERGFDQFIKTRIKA